MKVKVDNSRCEAHGQCEAIAPDFFTVDDDGYVNIDQDKEVPPELENDVREGVSACPMVALSIDD